jgi:hypothetical protein
VAVAADTRVSSGGRPGNEGGRWRVSETEFDRYAADYRATVNEAAGIAGVDVDRLAGHEARLSLGLAEQRLGDASFRKVLEP